MIGPLSISVALLLCPVEPHARVQVFVEPDFGHQLEWAARDQFAARIRIEAPKSLQHRLRIVYIKPNLLEISLPTRDDPQGAATAVNEVADVAVPAALTQWQKNLEMALSNCHVEIKNCRLKAEEWRQRAADETPVKRQECLQMATNYLNDIPKYETKIDRMERSLAEGLPRAKVIQRAKP